MVVMVIFHVIVPTLNLLVEEGERVVNNNALIILFSLFPQHLLL